MSEQIKSKKRVSDHGEVFTRPEEVNAMLNLVKNETIRVDSRFLEPACGDGNFLLEILKRKLNVITKTLAKSQKEFEFQSVIAIASLYGIELLQDNVKTCRTRLFNYLAEQYNLIFSHNISDEYAEIIKFILEKNIILGDALK